jgi:hypothetical protein
MKGILYRSGDKAQRFGRLVHSAALYRLGCGLKRMAA